MQLQGIRIVIIILFFASKSFGQSQKYRLKVIDSISYEVSCLYYFEFKKGGKTYKIISESYPDTLEPECLSTLEIGKKYSLSLNRIYWINIYTHKIGDIWIDLLKTRISSNSRSFGGLERPVYMCNAIFKNQISCECLVDRKKR